MIATIGNLPLQSYVKSWERFSSLTCTRIHKRRGNPIREISGLVQGHSFQEGLTALIASAMSGSLQKLPHQTIIKVDFHGPIPAASIELVGDISVWIGYENSADELLDVQPEQAGDLEQSTSISGKTILGLGELLRRNGSSN
ncbi:MULTISPECIES: hypothetical protein [Bradyrhizobium]|uniref:hypothetical protein n=1 Tax=Bradyrhizobium TaxID=374 RepID=UPI00155A822B|nr:MULTISPECIES: hypothetical protein [Bradyrhizobium]MCP1924720.1 hypothetical protein [Bradyrhizobium elkanii]MCS3584521.1 hypothetical protein [Bradyrhizobium elkanii]MCS3718101.1 hypothetical protein [Bradyrhizobium elkanii]MCS4011809.1 hypothetical protein [Bradyrhizobium elkanii USDA 61]